MSKIGFKPDTRSPAERHFRITAALAKKLKRRRLYDWLVTKGYFPESYVLPPCFKVQSHPRFGKLYFPHTKSKFSPRLSEYLQVHFPKTELTDRTFGIIDPEIHSDIARTIARNWQRILTALFHKGNKVYAYSFPVPLDVRRRGQVGLRRTGRMIYEFIEMAEHDLAAVVYQYKFLITTDVKNFYPSIYSHSIPWALHGKEFIRRGRNRYDHNLFGNRLDKLFQNASDGCTNGIPIGPVVSDLAAEVVLSGVDRLVSKNLNADVFVVRFKDDYRILTKTEADGKSFIKSLQAALKEYRLELNDEKTQFHKLPDGLFRTWASRYHTANPNPREYYHARRFREVYLSVVAIDRENPGCGVIDRFLADIVTRNYRVRVKLDSRTLPEILSLLLKLGDLRTKAFPKVLAIIEAIIRSPSGRKYSRDIGRHLNDLLSQLRKKESENKYLIAWIVYFLRANGLYANLKSSFSDPIVRSTCTSRFTAFKHCPDFNVFQGIRAASRKTSMLAYLDVFKPQ